MAYGGRFSQFNCSVRFIQFCWIFSAFANAEIQKVPFTFEKMTHQHHFIINGFSVKEFMRLQLTELKESGTFFRISMKIECILFALQAAFKNSWHCNQKELTSQFSLSRMEMSGSLFSVQCSHISHYSFSLELKPWCSEWRWGATWVSVRRLWL